jgi:hypothetical protein
MLEAPIHSGDAAVVYLAEALGKERPLSEVESRILHKAIRRDAGAFRRWTPEEDRKLLKMHKARIRGADIAVTLKRTEATVYQRLCRLKKRERAHG